MLVRVHAQRVPYLISIVLMVEAVVYPSLTDLPEGLKFDFIVAGGGTAGSVVASRLSEQSEFNVLLIEAGSDTIGVPELEIPAWATRRNETEFNWRFVSEPMMGLNNRTLDIPRGCGLGGSSAINGMAYTRGSADDYNSWGRVTQDDRWSWKALWPWIKRHEQFLGAVGGRNATGEFNPQAHGYSGNVQTSLGWAEHNEHDLRTLKNAALQPEFPVVEDLNGGKPLGVTWTQSTIGNGERCHAAKAYLGPAVRARPNLAILLNTHVTRVLQSSFKANVSDTDVVNIRTVELGPRLGGQTRRTVDASKEIIISAGSIGTPWLLLNSGIGNKTELDAIGVRSLVSSPAVGQGITEHVTLRPVWDSPPLSPAVMNEALALAMWRENRTGPLTERFPNHQLLWFKLPQNASVFKDFPDPSTGPTSPNIEFYMNPQSPGGSMILLTPYSRGTIKLRSSDPYARPRIDYNLLSHPFDIAALAEGIRVLKRFYSGPAWEGYITGFRGPDPDRVTPAEWDTLVRQSAATSLHPVGSARMGRTGDMNDGVVDPDLKVKGVRGLRIVDASVIPYVPTAHTQAPVYILAERASDIIKDEWMV